jgi:hypothetical protein
MVNFKRPRSSELIFIVDIDKTFSNGDILVNYSEDNDSRKDNIQPYFRGILCSITNTI